LKIGKNDATLNAKSLSKTEKFGSYVICEDKTLLFEEMPKAYKSIEGVVKDLVDLEIIKVIAIMKPVITYKTRK
jgi:release factor H-coupled RctB family protein